MNWNGSNHKKLNVSTLGDGQKALLAEKRRSELNLLPKPVGYLYRDGQDADKLLYSANVPDNLQEIATWDRALSFGNKSNTAYHCIITHDDDLVWVFRGELENTDENSRQNPIIFPGGDYANPIEVDFGERIKPSAWLQNCGADQKWGEDYFIFAEYTRPHMERSYLWKVTKPYTDPDNWVRVLDFEVDVDIEHFHTVQYDTFSDCWVATTGDSDPEVKIFISEDDGDTWSEVAGNSQRFRVLNYIFLEDKIYWASDTASEPHGLYRCGRDSNGLPDFVNYERVYNLRKGQPTYVTALIDKTDVKGLLLLGRVENPHADSHTHVEVYFWDTEFDVMRLTKKIPVDGINRGFRARCTSFYPNPLDDRIVVGFDHFTNRMNILTGTEKTLFLEALNKDIKWIP